MSESRITTPDGTEVVYHLHGDRAAGVPALVLTNGLTTDTGFWSHLLPVWSQRHQLLTWDLPGHGRSGRPQSRRDATIQGQPAILLQLMDTAGIGRAVQVGWSTGSQVVLELYRRAPERCLALISLLGSAGHVLDTARLPLPGALIETITRRLPRPIFERGVFLMTRAAHNRLGHAAARRLGLVGVDASAADVQHITEHLCTLDPATVQIMVPSAQHQSAHDLLPHIEVPMLIVTGDLDPFAPSETVGVPMQRAVPGSELVRLPNATHTGLLDHSAEIAAAVQDFMARRIMPERAPPGRRGG